jgi:exopolyphosphatase/guanosine-5'-triphosphate,3'-diphosphate pyrophosphatase
LKQSEWAEGAYRLAIIDLGSNSVRFDVVALNPRGQAERLHREKRMVRLGEGLFKNGRLEKTAVARVLAAFRDFSAMIKDWGIDHVTAIATSALRDAPEQAKLIREIQRRYSIRLRVISGRREAQLIAEGVLAQERLPKGKFALVDIGGGSAELSYCRNSRQLKGLSWSLNLGCLRLKQLFLSSQPPRPGELTRLRAHTRKLIKKLPPAPVIIGSSGTIRSLERMARRQAKPFNLNFLSRLNTEMALLDHGALLKLPGMEPKRVDLLLAGSVVLEELALQLKAKSLRATDFALRDGVLVEVLAKLKKSRRGNRRV